MPETQNIDFSRRCQRAYHHAVEISEAGQNWLVFFREVLGVNGIVRRLFPEPEEQLLFEQTVEYVAIQEMLGRLRKKEREKKPTEPNRIITVRLPKSVHEALQAEAAARGTSMNKLCLSKLLQVVDLEFAPSDDSD